MHLEQEDNVNAQDSQIKKIAVIAVHGVGKHLSGETAALIVTLIQTIAPSEYSVFRREDMQIPVCTQGLHCEKPSRVTGLYDTFINIVGSPFKNRNHSLTDQTIDIDFTKSLLKGGGEYNAVYDTVRFESQISSGNKKAKLDVYDLFWSDLSHAGSGGMTVFSNLMHLLTHVASLGRTTLASVIAANGRTGANHIPWECFYWLHATAYWLITRPLLLMNLLLAIIGLLALPLFIIDSSHIRIAHYVSSLICGLSTALVCGYCQYKHFRWCPSIPHILRPLALTALGFIVAAIIYCVEKNTIQILSLYGIGYFASYFVSITILTRYGQLKPDALKVWRWMYLGTALLPLYVYFKYYQQAKFEAVQILGGTAEMLFRGMVIIWLAIYTLNFIALIPAIWLWKRHNDEVKRKSIWTALIAASVPTPLLMTVILVVWLAFLKAIEKMGPGPSYNPVLATVPDLSNHNVHGFVSHLIDYSAGTTFLPYTLIVILAIFLAAAGLMPSIIHEAVPIKVQTTEKSWALGNWLDAGLKNLTVSASLMMFGFFILFPIGLLFQVFPGIENWIKELAINSNIPTSNFLIQFYDFFKAHGSLTTILGLAVGGTTISVIAASKWFTGYISRVLSGLRVLIDAAIDVDNWLREKPEGETPRLKIMARYVSLLRHIESHGYDSVIIVSHSQGTIITTDTFKYLTYLQTIPVNQPPVLSVKPILVTMGCPLKQLYAQRFPILYGWCNNHLLLMNRSGFLDWINAFGSGDYVGRFISRPPNPPNTWTPSSYVSCPLGSGFREFCIGAYTHTHYFDANNTVISNMIHQIIIDTI